MPPLPQPTRRRTNAPTIPTTTLVRRRGRAPRVPAHVTLGPAGRAWWRWAWSTPSASQWDESADVVVVARRAMLEDRLADPDAGAALFGQATQLDDRLGLTPKARAQLRWRVAGEAVGVEVAESDGVVVTPDRWRTA